MSKSLTARPTVYRGIQMRSRLEARWAAHLDETGCSWAYEPRAYADGVSQYLPDFQILAIPEYPGPASIPAFQEVRPTIDGAYRAMAQMPTIWASEPRALLMVVVPDLELYWVADRQAGGNARWRMGRL